MKVQVATFVLAEGSYIQFTIHLHDDRREELVSNGADIRKYIIDRITRRLRDRFGLNRPGFLFVVEDHDKKGLPVRPHAHGSIEVPMIDVHLAPARRRALANLAAQGKQHEAQLLAGRMTVRNELKAAAGLNKRASKVAASGRSQSRNVWTKDPIFMVMTHYWVNYAFKNAERFSQTLGEDRDAISTELRARARDLWEVIRNGDMAVTKIAARSQVQAKAP